MNLVRTIFFIILFYETSCVWERLVDINSINLNESTSRTYDVLIKILKLYQEKCSTVLISSDIKEINFKWLAKLEGEVTIFSHENLTNYVGSLQHFKKFDAFIFIIEMIINIDEIMFNIRKDTEWWNPTIPIFILYVKPCDVEAVENIFNLIEDTEAIKSYLLCYNANQEMRIYTYNPISNYAPDEWKPIEGITLNWNSTLFERTYNGDIGSNFDFDPTNHLGDYEIIVAGNPEEPFSTLVDHFHDAEILKNHPEYFPLLKRFMVDLLASAFKVKITIYFHAPQSSNKEYLESWPTFQYDTWFNSTCDIFLTVNTVSVDEPRFPLKGSYPASWAAYAIVTYHQGYQTPLEKIREFYGVWISLFTLFVLVSTSIVIWLTQNKNVAFTVFEIIRLLISQSLYSRMNTLSLRIFFGVVLIYFLIIQATFNGHLAEFLTKPQLRKHPNTLEELQDLGFTEIYRREDVKSYLAKTPEDKATLESLTKTCLRYLIQNNTSAACVENYIELLNQIRNQKKLYMSQKTFGSFYAQFPIRQDSPLYFRLYRFFMLFEELGFRQYINLNVINHFNYKDQVEAVKMNHDFQPINLENLMFSFVVLGIGLCTATLTFIIEILYILKNIKIKSKLRSE